MAKTAMLWARVEDETIVKLDEIVAASIGDRSDHIRKALDEYIRRHQVKAEWAEASTLDDHDSLGVVPS